MPILFKYRLQNISIKQLCRSKNQDLLSLVLFNYKFRVVVRVFSLNFRWGETSKFSVPVGDEVRWGGGETCEKNPTEAKTAHLMQN